MRLIYKGQLALYLIAIGFGVFTPRPDLVGQGTSQLPGPSKGGFPSIGDQILYLGGTWAWIGNFLMLMPFAFLISKSWPLLRLQTIFIASALLTISIELIQIYIPGRVSDVRDIALNATGAALVLLYLHLHKSSKSRAQK